MKRLLLLIIVLSILLVGCKNSVDYESKYVKQKTEYEEILIKFNETEQEN